MSELAVTFALSRPHCGGAAQVLNLDLATLDGSPPLAYRADGLHVVGIAGQLVRLVVLFRGESSAISPGSTLWSDQQSLSMMATQPGLALMTSTRSIFRLFTAGVLRLSSQFLQMKPSMSNPLSGLTPVLSGCGSWTTSPANPTHACRVPRSVTPLMT